MAETDVLTRSPVILRPDPARTVIRPFLPGDPAGFAVAGHPRSARILDRILALEPAAVAAELRQMTEALDGRHRNVEAMMLRRFDELEGLDVDRAGVSRDQALLVGAYFSEEYSFEAAALFNPSMARRPEQDGVPDGGVRFVMSLRGIGEGHVSSVTFRTGVWSAAGGFAVDPPSATAVPPRIERMEGTGDDGAYHLVCDDSRDISETVLFPVTPSQRQGIEDVRLVDFTDDAGEVSYLGTYTAFSGSATRSELFRATSFNSFVMRPLRGAIADSKGTALFPRLIDGRYAMLGRQDSESIWLLDSDSLYDWRGGAKLVSPRYPWEFVQMGNCGSPIEIDEGWLVLTHGVGVVRNYCIGACLLDRKDPSKLLARTREPLLRPSQKERDGYVPNVVYSCGGLVHDRTLLLPYGVADNFATFASAPVDAVLALMD